MAWPEVAWCIFLPRQEAAGFQLTANRSHAMTRSTDGASQCQAALRIHVPISSLVFSQGGPDKSSVANGVFTYSLCAVVAPALMGVRAWGTGPTCYVAASPSFFSPSFPFHSWLLSPHAGLPRGVLIRPALLCPPCRSPDSCLLSLSKFIFIKKCPCFWQNHQGQSGGIWGTLSRPL